MMCRESVGVKANIKNGKMLMKTTKLINAKDEILFASDGTGRHEKLLFEFVKTSIKNSCK